MFWSCLLSFSQLFLDLPLLFYSPSIVFFFNNNNKITNKPQYKQQQSNNKNKTNKQIPSIQLYAAWIFLDLWYFPGVWSVSQGMIPQEKLYLSQQLVTANSFKGRLGISHLLPFPWEDFVWLGIVQACAQCHNSCEFLRVAALKIPEHSISFSHSLLLAPHWCLSLEVVEGYMSPLGGRLLQSLILYILTDCGSLVQVEASHLRCKVCIELWV